MSWNAKSLVSLLGKVRYKDWEFRVLTKGDGFLLQPKFYDKVHGFQSCRKWYLSSYMTKSEVIQTAFKAVLSAEEHEVREAFTYDNQTIFSPHFDVDDRVEAMRDKAINIDARPKVEAGLLGSI